MANATKIEDITAKTHYCPQCGKWLEVGHENVKFNIRGVNLEITDSPVLKCLYCKKPYFSNFSNELIEHHVKKAKKANKGTMRIQIKTAKREQYNYSSSLDFIYDQEDYVHIPGLMDSEKDGFHVPVFFNLKVLNRYASHQQYQLDLFSRSHCKISRKDVFSIECGINRAGLVFAWLGEIDTLPRQEQEHFRSENVPSDHDVFSHFYEIHTGKEPSFENPLDALLNARQRADSLCLKHRRGNLYKFATEIDRPLYILVRPYAWQGKPGGKKINAVDIFLNHSLNSPFLQKELMSYIKCECMKITNPIELLEKWVVYVLNDENPLEVALPFRMLNDFRDLAMNLASEDEAKKIKTSLAEYLKITENKFEQTGNEKIFNLLADKLLDSYNSISDGLRIFTREM